MVWLVLYHKSTRCELDGLTIGLFSFIILSMKLSAFQKGLLVVLIALLLFGGIIFINRILLADVFCKEEAQHALNGLWLCKDLRNLDWKGFWYDTQRQMFWPFFHSWILAIFFLFFGISYISARFLSLVIFFATLILMYVVANRFSEKSGWKIGILSVFLALSSPLMIRFSAENTLEGLGALIFLVSFYLYTIAEQRKLSIYYVFLALGIGLSIYTNYLYAYLMIPAFLVATLGKLGPIFVETLQLTRKGEKSALQFLWWAYRKLITLVVLLLVAGAWFLTSAFSRKFMLLLQAIFRYSGGESVQGLWQNLLFYPKAIIQNYTFSPWLGILMVISLFLPLIAVRYFQLNKLYVFIWTVIVLVTLTIPTKAPQLIYIIAPFLLIVFSATVFYGLERLNKYGIIILLVIFVPALISIPRLGSLYFPSRPAEKTVKILNYFHWGVLPRYPIASSINLQHLSPEVIIFHFWDWNAPVLADPIVGEDGMFRSARYFLTVEIDPNSPYQTEVLDDSIFRWNMYLQEKLRAGEIRENSQRRFEGLGVTAKIYEKIPR